MTFCKIMDELSEFNKHRRSPLISRVQSGESFYLVPSVDLLLAPLSSHSVVNLRCHLYTTCLFTDLYCCVEFIFSMVCFGVILCTTEYIMADKWAATSSDVTIFRKFNHRNIVSKRHKTAKMWRHCYETSHNVSPEYENSVNIKCCMHYQWF